MEKKFKESEIRELESQLSLPSGQMGIEVGKKMNETNIGMTLNSIDFLELKEESSVLELGHGNCGHLEKLLGLAEGVRYFGLEISETMRNEAEKNNSNRQAEFKLYDGKNLPFANNFFDRIMSVNTIYFWQNPEKLMQEIERTLEYNGICVLTYADKEFMKDLPLVGEKFKLFDKKDVEKLVSMSNLKIIAFRDKTEFVKSKTGEQVERKYTMAKIKKVKA
ncbi:methyltransferase domain-containing protein [Muricauda sp. TY007]|uniref:class I SAM-dependent methyltransferase n=1 Tax=Allomuricauda sp. TY007 TaxID=2683200 RepID=UPI0013C24874|nr:class I SAM-dependent methyltransferase [Muricauda sp. TY007]NDV16799.1 methyltransferase domain-containing protein [Muricauda sp. TY007]